jgi:primosomal protein N'
MISKTNRIKSLSNRKGTFWCDYCDMQKVHPGEKCKRCGKKQLKRRLRQGLS